MNKTRVCSKCNKRKKLNDKTFGKTGEYYRNVCRKCWYLHVKEWKINNKERVLVWSRAWSLQKYKREGGESASNRAWRARPEVKERINATKRRAYARERLAALSHYSKGTMKCACKKCPETNIRFLTLDHINNDGAEHRRSMGFGGKGKPGGSGTGESFYRRLRFDGYPKGFQVLCFNCNCGRSANGGICPHND